MAIVVPFKGVLYNKEKVEDFGKVMGAVMGKLKGQADGGIVNKVVKELLG